MGKIKINFREIIILLCILFIASACSKFSASPTENTSYPINKTEIPKKIEPLKIEKADFTMTSEEYVKTFTLEKITAEDLKKYASKIFAVSGHIKQFSLDKDGYAPPYVVLDADGSERGVLCILDTSDPQKIAGIRSNNLITIQGTIKEFPNTEVPPSLNNCFVLKAE